MASSKLSIQISWAMTGELLDTIVVRADETVGKLKEILSHAAKTPAVFLDLMFDARAASDFECLYVFSQRNWTDAESEAEMETLQCLALRKAPPRLIDVARERYQREVWGVTGTRRKLPGFPGDVNRLWDMKVLQYILQADPQGVNDTDESWCLNDLHSGEGFYDPFPWNTYLLGKKISLNFFFMVRNG
eukprot:symbB.v1.2.001290.t1/scaffold68.1/size354569/12